MVLCFSSRL